MANSQIQPKEFSSAMEQHWTTNLQNVPSPALMALWETMCETFNKAMDNQESRWSVLQPPTGTGKTQGLAVYSAMTAKANRGVNEKVGLLIATRLIEQANELEETINRLAGFKCAVTKHSENKISPQEMAEADVLIITHAAYVKASEFNSQGHDRGWSNLLNWAHGKRALTLVDESLANIIDEYQVKAEDVRLALSYVTPDLRQRFPQQVALLEMVKDLLEHMEREWSSFPESATKDFQVPSVVAWRDGEHRQQECEWDVSMAPLADAMKDIRYDHIALKRDSEFDRKRIQMVVESALKSAEAVTFKWSYYAKAGKDHTLNAATLLIPKEMPPTVVLDATAKQNMIWELLEDQAVVVNIPEGTRNYANVTLHVARAASTGKRSMEGHGQTRIPRLLSDLENRIGKDREVFLCVHKSIEHIPKGYSPAFRKFDVAHWNAVDGRNDWQSYDTAVIFGLPYRTQVWATNAFFSVQGVQDDDWMVNPKWKQYSDIREELMVKQITVSVVQAINRIRCRRVIDADGNCSISDVFIVLPVGKRGDRILEAISQEMPNIQQETWDFNMDGQKVRVRRGSSHEALVTFMSNRMPGQTPMTHVSKELGLKAEAMKDLKETLRNPDHPLSKQLKDMGVSYETHGYGRGTKAYLSKV